VDRQIGGINDGYTTTTEMIKLFEFFWIQKNYHGAAFRNCLAVALTHFGIMRGENVREMELADLHMVDLENEGVNCMAMVMIIKNGKTNQVNRMEVAACLRNKEVQICPVSTFAIYLFWRFHVENEPFPDFTTSKNWFFIKVLC
jgi:hypothetical protein